ncbi:uncharacterized protein LOC116033123 [Ipomoea triloba]|uniref:uncharacterized protein LOC116033123 n=1 Tax=Ipomoea triloba TaxID=35885 RepID=UPI00125D2CD2|nr:uncharacterized protein LOC116033123 [Ipomoea triloba]
MVDDQKPSGNRAGLGYNSNSQAQVLLTKPSDPSTSGGLKSMFVQGQTVQPKPMIVVEKRMTPQTTSQSKGKERMYNVLWNPREVVTRGVINTRINIDLVMVTRMVTTRIVNQGEIINRRVNPAITRGKTIHKGYAIVSLMVSRTIWYVDRGCSRHMTGNKSGLSNYRDMNGHKVVFGGKSSAQTKGVGTHQQERIHD